MTVKLETYDYIIVGAGSAGCVMANRLSANPDCRVLLLEAGGSDWHPFIHMPAGLAKLTGIKSINWNYETEAEAELLGRRLYWPRGKVLGGSSSINAMCYCRGHRKDYDLWAELGNPGWSFDEVLPYFVRSENNARFGAPHHGQNGPLHVTDLKYHNPLSEVFLAAAEQAGYGRTDDFNGAHQRGFGFYQVTQNDGKRDSAAQAYLKPAMARDNLTVITRALCTGLKLKGDCAVGVNYRHRRRAHTAHARSEVLLCGGAINSPQVLMLSGIGDEAMLRNAGIPVRHVLPGVGRNLQDHLDVCLVQRCRENITYDKISDVRVGLQYYLFGRGPGNSNIAEAGGFWQTPLAEDDRPDVQFHFVPAILDDHGRNRIRDNGYTLHMCYLRPRSRGHLALVNDDPALAPRIHANYLSNAHDLAVMKAGVQMQRTLFAQAAFDRYRGAEMFPGEAVQSEADIEDFIRRKAETIYHPIGTCRMGDDAEAVVDHCLRVHGVQNLRVVDASVMPRLVSGNTNAPTIMIAEKISDEMLANGQQTQRSPLKQQVNA